MAQIDYPFIVNMIGYSKDDRFVYIVMECIGGGELFVHLRRARKFSDEQAKFYGALTAAGFAHIHSKNIIHRDLKPENILVCQNGYSKLTDFGFAKILEPGTRTYTLCGTPEYIAPEVLLNKGHGKPVDWWTLGILIYEMIVGQPPFCDEEPMGIYQKILAGKIYFPKYFDKNAKALVKKLVTADLSKRYPPSFSTAATWSTTPRRVRLASRCGRWASQVCRRRSRHASAARRGMRREQSVAAGRQPRPALPSCATLPSATLSTVLLTADIPPLV